jgi:hypothetical protein
MKIRTLLGLAAIGGVAYAHNKRGGEWTLDGIKETVRQLFSGMQDRLSDLAAEAKDRLAQERDITPGSRPTGYGIGGSDVTGYNR